MRVYCEARGFILLGIDNPGVVAKQWRRATRQAAIAVLWHWIEKLLPKHFQRSNWHRYKFRLRKASTQKKKARKYGHTAALVNWPIGHPPTDRPTLERFMEEMPDIQHKGDGAMATWRTPGINDQYKQEATAVNDEDAREMAGVFHDSLIGAIRSGRAPLKQKVRRGMGYAALQRMERIRIV